MKRAVPTSILAVLLACATAFPVAALSDDQRGSISQYCGTIRQTLKTIQREDARTRIALGATYETIISNFVTPLNLRLVSNNISNQDSFDFQASFAATRADFSTKFIEYSRSLESLIATDCQQAPDIFYSRLETTRNLRTEVYNLATSLTDSAIHYQSYLPSLKESL